MHALTQLDFGRPEIILLFLLPALANLLIFGYINLFLPQGRTNMYLSLFVLLTGLWQAADGFMHLATNKETAGEWYYISAIFLVFILPFGVMFSLSFSKWLRHISFGTIILTQFVPAIICLFLIVARQDVYVMLESAEWYWIVNPLPVSTTLAIYTWLSLGALTMFALLWMHFLKVRQDSVKRRQALLLAIGFGVPVMSGVIVEAILPIFFGTNDIPVTAPFSTIFSVAALIAIRKYRLLEYSPRYQWNQIMGNLQEGILIVNRENKVMFANQMICDLLGYGFEEIRGKDVTPLFGSHEKAAGNTGDLFEIQLRSKIGENTWVMMSHSPCLDRTGRVIGSIMIQTNIDTLKKKEERLRLAIEAGKMMTIDVDFITGRVLLSENAPDLLGIEPGIENMSAAMEVLLHPEDKNMITRSLTRTMEEGLLEDIQFRIIRPDNGKIIWLERRGATLRDLNGKISGMRALLIDVTRKKENEEVLERKRKELYAIRHDLERSEKSLREAQKMAHLGSWEADHITGETTWSDEIYSILGISRDEVQPSFQAFLSFVHPEDRDMIRELISNPEQPQEFSVCCRIIRPDGTTRFVTCDCKFKRDKYPSPVGTYGIIHDITEKHLAQQKLEYSESRLKQAQELAHVGNWEMDLFTGKSIWSEEACKIYGLDPGAKEQTFESWISFIHPEDLSAVKTVIARTKNALSNSSFYHRIIRPDGTVRHVYSESRFEFDKEGKPVGLYGVAHDVTEMKELEQNLKTINKELETFIYKASHDLRGPLASLIGLINLCKVEIKNEDSLKYMGMIELSANKLDATLSGLVKSVQIKDSQVPQDKVDAEGLIYEILEKLKFSANFSRLHIFMKNHAQKSLYTNRAILESVLQNLIENAIKYQNSQAENSYIDIELQEDMGQLCVKISDNGIGIAHDAQARIFDMYFRATEESQGSGLGLYLVKLGVEKLGGRIELKSEKGIGSEFMVYLPLSYPAAVAA